MTATSKLRLFKHSLCCCSLAFCSWFSLFLNWINSQSSGGGGENNQNKNKFTFKIEDRKRLEREKPSKKSSHVFPPEKTLVRLQILQKGKVQTVCAPSPLYLKPSTTIQHAGCHTTHSPGRNRSNEISFQQGKKEPNQLWAQQSWGSQAGSPLPAAPCRGGRAQLQPTGCHGNHQSCRSSASPVAWWAPPLWTRPAPARAAFAGTGCSSVQSPPLQRRAEHNSCPEKQPSVGCFQGST